MPFWCQLICSYYSFLVIRNLQYCHSYHCYHDDDDNDDFDHPSFSLSPSFCCKKHWAGIRSSYIIQTDHKIPLNWKMDICHIWNFAYLSWRVKLFVTFFSLLNHKFLSLFCVHNFDKYCRMYIYSWWSWPSLFVTFGWQCLRLCNLKAF